MKKLACIFICAVFATTLCACTKSYSNVKMPSHTVDVTAYSDDESKTKPPYPGVIPPREPKGGRHYVA